MMDINKLKYIFFNKDYRENQIRYYKLQASIIDKLNKHRFVFCFDEVGTGKTVQSMYAIWNIVSNKSKGEKSSILIIAPNEQLAIKWRNEIKQYLALDFTIVHNRNDEHKICYSDDKDNLFITYNSSNYSNLGIGKLTKFTTEYDKNTNERKDYIWKSNWDLIIIDEAHAMYENYYKALFREPYWDLAWHRANQVLVLTATPIRFSKDKDSYYKVLDIPKKLLDDNTLHFNFDVDNFLKFDVNIPYQRYFKELVLENENSKNRTVEILRYEISEKMKYIWMNTTKSKHMNCCNIFLLFNETNLDEIERQIYSVYKKDVYEKEDIDLIRSFDKKMDEFIRYIESLKEVRIVIFCSMLDSKSYIRKVLEYLNINVTTIDTELKAYERDRRVHNFNKMLCNKAIITTWQIGNYGINLHGADTVICYESAKTVNEIEQGFGRIDRMNLGYKDIKMIFFRPDNELNYFDNYRLNLLYYNLFSGYLPNIPSKNIMFDNEFLDNYISKCKYKKRIYEELLEFCKAKIVSNLNEDLVKKDIDENVIKEWCVNKSIDYNEILFDIIDSEGKYSLSIVSRRLNEYKRIVENIDAFINIAKEAGCNGDNPSNILGKAIYYYQNNMLKIISINELLEESKKYTSETDKEFTTELNGLESSILDFKDKDMISEEFSEVFAKAIKIKLEEVYSQREEEIQIIK